MRTLLIAAAAVAALTGSAASQTPVDRFRAAKEAADRFETAVDRAKAAYEVGSLFYDLRKVHPLCMRPAHIDAVGVTDYELMSCCKTIPAVAFAYVTTKIGTLVEWTPDIDLGKARQFEQDVVKEFLGKLEGGLKEDVEDQVEWARTALGNHCLSAASKYD